MSISITPGENTAAGTLAHLRHQFAGCRSAQGLPRKRRAAAANLDGTVRQIAVLGLFVSALAVQAQVGVRQGTLTLPTYEEGTPDPNLPSTSSPPIASTIPTPYAIT